MKQAFISEKLFLEEVRNAALQLQSVLKGLSIGTLIRSIRKQLGMSQRVLAKRSGIPQATISRIEQGQENVELSTLCRLLHSMSCDLVIAPLLRGSIETIRQEQAKKIAQRQVQYLTGTMNLEQQEPDPKFIESLMKQEIEKLLQGASSQLWED